MKARTTKPKIFGIAATMLLATLLIAAVIVPAVSAQETNGETMEPMKVEVDATPPLSDQNNNSGNVSIRSLSTDATLNVNPQTGNINTVFRFDAEATYELDIYGIPIPGGFKFEHDINYTAFHQPVVIGSSWSGASFVYKKDTPIGKSWHFYKHWLSIGGPTTKYIDSHTWPKTTGSYNNRLRAWIGLLSSDTDTKTVLIT